MFSRLLVFVCRRGSLGRVISAARSQMTTHGAMVLPVVARGMMDASAVLARTVPLPTL
jgi:hypothetical protein